MTQRDCKVIVLTFVVLLFGTLPLHAQPAAASTSTQSGDGARERVKKVLDVFDHTVYPVVRSVAPGGGFGPGIGYRAGRKEHAPWVFRSEALVTLHKYWSVEGSLQYPRGWLNGEVFGRVRDMKRLDFFGLGPDTSPDSRTNYRQLDRSIGASVSVHPLDFDKFEIGGRLERLWPEITPGRNKNHLSIEQRFSDATAPGLSRQPSYFSPSWFIGVMYPGFAVGANPPRYGSHVRLTRRAFHDDEDGRFNFGRTELEGQERLPGFDPTHMLTLRQYFSTTHVDEDEGRQVPFYMQQTLGGTGSVRGFHESLLGIEGTQASLRGFRNLRFRGPHLLLLQAEYTFKVRGPLEASVFADAGNVALRRGDLSLGDLKKDFGFSLGVAANGATMARIDIGAGGGEGARIFFSFGGLLQR